MASLLWPVLLVCLAAPCVKSLALDADCSGAGATCTPANSYCKTDNSNAKACKCKTGATVNGDACDIDDKSIGGACGDGCPTNGDCIDAKCVCLINYIVDDVDLKTCNKIAGQKVGAECDPDSSPEDPSACGDPAVTFLECPSQTTECACKTGYEGNAGEDCEVAEKYIGGACGSSNECDTVTNSECSETKCQCSTGYAMKTGDVTACEVAEQYIGGACGSGDKCDTVTNSECSETKCQCSSGYAMKTGDVATCELVPAKKVGKTCTPGSSSEADDVCGTPGTTNLECKTGTTECACKSGYMGDKGGDCTEVPERKVGRTCDPASSPEANTACGVSGTTNLECPDGTTECACTSGYMGDKGEDCTVVPERKVGRTCDPSSSPEATSACGPPATTFLECKTGATECTCKSGYTGSKGGDCTKKSQSGAGALVGSLVTVGLAAILHVFTRH